MRRRLISTTRPSITISLFAEPSVAPRAPSSFALSIVVHGLVAGLLYLALTRAPRIIDPTLLQHFAVRQLDLHSVDPNFPQRPAEAKYEIPYPHLDPAEAPIPQDLQEAMRTFLHSAAGHQTLIQPEIHSHRSFAEKVPLPSIMIWSPGHMPQKKLVAPPPTLDTSSYVTPSLDLPNQEIKLADLAVSSVNKPVSNMTIPPSSTAPVATSAVKPQQAPVITTSRSVEQPTPAAVLSISEIHMEQGTLFLPPVNDVAKSAALATATTPGNGSGTGSGSGSAPSSLPRPEDPGISEAERMTADGRRLTFEHIQLPKDGKFNVVVVGSTLAEDYPQTADLWANRVAYTAYLRVGLKKNWILQYSATRSADLASAGNVSRLEAPWPYDIQRPNLIARDVNGDALMVHGVLNQAGRLESLAVVFPGGFRYSSYVLYALRHWQFRPARQNGQPTPVEVLLIIPEELD